MTLPKTPAFLLALSALATPQLSLAKMPHHCPSPKHIMRTTGTYNWQLTPTLRQKGSVYQHWGGFFAAPIEGRGYSTAATHFIEARWIQLNNLPHSAGYIECDYRGNFKREVIRFSLKEALAVRRPKGDTWNYTLKTYFPAVAARCAGDEKLCNF